MLHEQVYGTNKRKAEKKLVGHGHYCKVIEYSTIVDKTKFDKKKTNQNCSSSLGFVSNKSIPQRKIIERPKTACGLMDKFTLKKKLTD